MSYSGVFHTEEIGPVLRTAQVLGITTTAFLCGMSGSVQASGDSSYIYNSGQTFSQSYITTPSLLLAPAPLLAKQWMKMLERNVPFEPAMLLFSASVFSYLARKGISSHLVSRSSHLTETSVLEPALTTPRILYSTSIVFLGGYIPYSLFYLRPLTEKLKSKTAAVSAKEQEDVGIQREETVHWLVDQWGLWNLGRTLIAGVAGLLATWAAVEKLVIREFKVVPGGGIQRGRL